MQQKSSKGSIIFPMIKNGKAIDFVRHLYNAETIGVIKELLEECPFLRNA